jgi:hypothetical protein
MEPKMMIYLACPYTHKKDPEISKLRYELATKVAGWLMTPDCPLGRYVVISPLTHSHPISELSDIPHFDWDFWRYQDFELIRRCDQFWILKLRGWRQSTGVTDETKLTEDLKMPIVGLDIDMLPPNLQVLAQEVSEMV